VLGRAVSFGLSLAATVILLYFLLASEHWMVVRTVEAIPKRRDRAIVLCAVRAAQRQIAVYIGAVAVINLVVAALTALAMMWIGLPNPVLWGTVAGVLNFIPYLGPITACAIFSGAALITFPTLSQALAVPGVFILLHLIEGQLVQPLTVGRRCEVNALVVLLGVWFGFAFWGIAGVLLATPVLVALKVAAQHNTT